MGKTATLHRLYLLENETDVMLYEGNYAEVNRKLNLNTVQQAVFRSSRNSSGIRKPYILYAYIETAETNGEFTWKKIAAHDADKVNAIMAKGMYVNLEEGGEEDE